MSIVNGGTWTLETKSEAINPMDRMVVVPAISDSIALDAFVTVTNTDLVTTGDAATCTRALKVLTADKIAFGHNLSRALDIVTAATAGELSVVKVGDSIEIDSVAAGIVIEIIDNTNVRVDASGTMSAAAATYQRAMFKDVWAGATLVLATGTTTVTVESKTSNFAVITTTSGTITTGALTSYKNIESLITYKSDDSRGKIFGVAMEAYTATTAYAAANLGSVKVKVFGEYDRDKTTTSDYATAGTVPNAVHQKVFGQLFHTKITRKF
jgi:hypothetical protein